MHDRFIRTSPYARSLLILAALLLGLTACSAARDTSVPHDEVAISAIDGDYTVEAIGSNVTRVAWHVDGVEAEVDEAAPFQLTIDLSGLTPGEHQIRALISIDVLDAESDVERTLDFTVGGDGDDGGTSWTLVDAVTDTDLAPFASGDTVTAPDPTAVNARLDGVEGPVDFYVDGAHVQTEDNEPYALFGNDVGDDGADYDAGDLSGEHTVRAVAGDGSEHVVTVTVTTTEGDGDEDPIDENPGDGTDNVFGVQGERTTLNGEPFLVTGIRASNALISDAATTELIDHLDAFRSYGVNTFSVFVQGSRFGDVRGFEEDGSLSPEHADRLARLIEAADARDMVVLVGGLYYGGSDNRWSSWTQDDADRAIAELVRWLSERNYRNVFIDPDNQGMAMEAEGWSIGSMIAAGKAVDDDVIIGFNARAELPANADILLNYSDKDGVRPYVQSEGSPHDYWGSWSREPGVDNYVNIGVYTDAQKQDQIERTDVNLQQGYGYMIGSSWLQAAPPEGPNHRPGGDGTEDDPGIRWWLEALQDRVGPYAP